MLVNDQTRTDPASVQRHALASAEPIEGTGRLVSLTDGREHPIVVVPFVLGRDPSAQVVLGSPDASRRHAEIVTRPDGDVLIDWSSNGTYVNGTRIDGRRALKPLDVIRIGSDEFRYYPGASLAPSPAHRLNDTLAGVPSLGLAVTPIPVARSLATIRIKRGPAKGARFSIRAPMATFGRGEANDVRIDDPSVSGSHARLSLVEGIWTLQDLGSTNGTVVDGVKVTEDVPLSPGATIELGAVALSFEPHDEPTPAPAGPIRTPAEPARPQAAPIILETGRESAPRFRLLVPVVVLALLAGLAALIFLV